MKRQMIYALTLTATLIASAIPAHADPIAPSSRPGSSNRAMCNDVYLGQNIQNNVHERNDILKTSQNDIGRSSNAWNYMNGASGSSRQSAGGGGGFNLLGFGASGSGGSSSASTFNRFNSGSSSNSSSFDRSSTYAHDRSTRDDTSSSMAVVGQDCTAVVQSRTAITQQLMAW
jgi:hypothetical protein